MTQHLFILRIVCLLGVLCASLPIMGQRETGDSLIFFVDACQGVALGEHTPFWQVANRQGLSSVGKGNGYFGFGAIKEMESESRFSWGAGVDLAVPWRFTSEFVVQQLYAEVKYRSLSLLVGSKDHEPQLVDAELSSGELVFSGNARPIPQVRAGIMEFQPLRFVNDWIGIKGYLSYGKFTDSRWQERWAAPGSRYCKGTLLCSRSIWLKGGDEYRFPLVFNIGLDMATQFGGTIYNPDPYAAGQHVDKLKMPSGFKSWIKALIPMPGDDDVVASESTNVEGNTIGTWNFSLDWVSGADWSVRAYWQHMFEDHSMMWIQFPWKDGLWGVEAHLPRNPFVDRIVCEYIYSKFQSGPVYNDTTPEVPEQVSGVDRYYNHGLYPGWMHWGMGIGNPFFISPIYNRDHLLMFKATRNISYHLGLAGSPIPDLDWRILVSNTRSWGEYWYPFKEVRHMWNFLASVRWEPSGWKNLGIQASVAFDRGDLVGNNFGVMLGISYDLPVAYRNSNR